MAKASLAEVPPVLFALLGYMVASGLLVALAQIRGGLAKLPRPAPWGVIALLGLTGVSLYYIGYKASLYYTTSSQGA